MNTVSSTVVARSGQEEPSEMPSSEGDDVREAERDAAPALLVASS